MASMKNRLLPVASALALSLLVPAVRAASAPESAPMTDAEKAQYAARVKDETLRAWSAYRQYAWGHDELHPLTHKPFDWYGHSLLMTPVDALDTLVIMGLKPQADEDRALIDTQLNFDQDIYVKEFEITIRMIGGLLSSYQLTGDKRLLELADDLGHRMLPMFNSPTGMPREFINLRSGAVRGTESNPAEIGTLLIEFGMLSRLTGKPEYYDKAKHAMVELYNRRSAKGLFGSAIKSKPASGPTLPPLFRVAQTPSTNTWLKPPSSSTIRTVQGCGRRASPLSTSTSPTSVPLASGMAKRT